MISIDKHDHETITCVSDIDLLIKSTTHDANLPNFSLRDYVYGSRCKDNIACNWPFSSKSLQHCLKSGVRNLLPPFESLNSLRSYNCVAKNLLPNEEILSSLDGKLTDDLFVSVASSSIKSQCHLEEKLAHIKSNSQRLTVMKVNPSVDLLKEITASKVCPVCKTFSSSSNNTLNAHIDRCLSEESSMKSLESPKTKTVVKYRIKPRKTRLMLDIYKTAPRCTIEELDRRNGSNWATCSSFPDQEFEFQVEENKDEPQEPIFIPEIDEHEDHEGAVYIDTNGTKVRILSTSNFSKLDDSEARDLHKGGKRIKFVSKKKKNKGDVQKLQRKILKLSPSSKKFSKKIVDKHAISGQEENIAVESCIKEDGGEKPMKAQEHKQMDDLAITRPPWACSKRTGHAKKRKFQESLKQKSIMEEDTSGKLSFDPIVNDLGVKKKKFSTSKSLSGDSSSGGVEITSESAGNDQVPFQGSFTGLRNSMDDEFSKIVSQLDNKFDSGDDIEKQGNYFVEVDPIPIPGPPGSFLPPSPGADDMVSEEDEVQGNSSLTTTSRVHSSDQDHRHHDIMNHDFVSDSPISNLSSPSYAKSPQDKISLNISDLRSADAIFTERGQTLCRCSRKEGTYRQESSERSLESNVRSNSLKRPDLLSLTLPPPQTFKLPTESSVKLPVSPTTPVLRLMGKNLIVVNTDEDQYYRPPLGSSPMGHNLQNENHNKSLFYGYPPQHDFMPQFYNNHPPNFSRSISDLTPAHAFDTMFPNRTNLLMPPANCHRLDTKMETNVNMDNAFSKPTREIVINDSSENEADDHMFNDRMRKNQTSYIPMHQSHGFTPVFRDVLNDGNLGGWASTETRSPWPSVSHMSSNSTAYYRRSFSLPTTRIEDRV